MTVATWTSAGLSDVPQSQFGVAGATFNTIRQAAYGLGISVTITLIASAADVTSLGGIKRAYVWVGMAYVASAGAVMATFPSGSARDRGQAS